MENRIILAISGLLAGFVALVVSFIAARLAVKEAVRIQATLSGLPGRMDELEAAYAAAVEHADLSARGARGVQVRAQNKEMREAAMAEGRALFASDAPLEVKKEQLVQLAVKYPKVAEEVTDGLISELGLSAYAPVLKAVVASAAQAALTKKSDETASHGSFYGI